MASDTYEVYVFADGRWILETVEKTEAAARACGERLGKARPGVRVVKSRPMPGGKTVERVIYEKQPPSSARSMGEPFIPPRGAYPVGELDAAPSCQSVEDYCNLASRITIRRLLWRYLDEANLTVSELLYCTTEASRIMKGDPLVAASIDRVAQLQARITGLDAKGRRDEIQTALDRVLLRTRNAEARLNNVGFVGHGLGELLAAAEACSSPESRNWVTLVALTNQLFGIRNMTQKLARVVYWSREADPQAMIVLDGLAADILGSQNVVHDLIGQKPNLGLHLCGVADLMRGELDAPGRTAPETAVELNRMIGENRLPATRVVLGERIIKNLKLNQPLSKNEPSAELELFRQLLDRLLLPGGMVGGFLMADALTERCLRARNLGSKTGRQEALISVASTTMDCQRTAHYLLALVSPEGGRVWLADVVKAVEHIFLRASDVSTLTPPAMAPKDRLKALVTTFRLFQSSSGLPADTVKAVCAKLDQFQADYLNRERIVEKLDRAEDPLRLRATRLLQFCSSGLMIEGRSSEIARRRVLDHLRQPRFDERFVEGIADAEERQSALREFYRLLKQAGLDEAVTTMMRNKAAQSATAAPSPEVLSEHSAVTALLPDSGQTMMASPGVGGGIPAPPPAASTSAGGFRRPVRRPAAGRCLSCFEETGPAAACPACGYNSENAAPAQPYLQPGFVLSNRYVVGRLLGCGGFGSTYLGWDDKLHVKVAVKEYYPSFLVSRTADNRNVRPHSEDSADQFYFGMEKFLDEARLLAQFRDVREIINVVDFFEENDTAYIVMEYVAGRPLNTVLKERGGRLPLTEVIGLVLPIIIALEKLHERNIIHRDISPDNIYLADDGRVKLLDFGAARQALGDKTQSMTVVLKRGYAPAEQYSSTSRQGPWTDVYALCATIYRAITGQPPPEAVSRWEDDPLVPPSRMGVAIPASVEAALLKGMTLRWQERLQNMAELRDAMRGR